MNKNSKIEQETDVLEQDRALWKTYCEGLPQARVVDCIEFHRRYEREQRSTQRRLTAACLMMAALIVVLPLVPIHRSTVFTNGASRGEVLDHADQLIALL